MTGPNFLVSLFKSLGRGRNPPLTKDQRVLARKLEASGLFDPTYYRGIYTDVDQSGLDPLEHFIRFGVPQNRNPSAKFDVLEYVRTYPDVLKSKTFPVAHYIDHGINEEREIRPVQMKQRPVGAPRLTAKQESLARALEDNGFFNATFYEENYDDVASSGFSALDHYLLFGVVEHRNPNPHFDVLEYLRTYPDVKKSKMYPVVHFLGYGRHEGRKATPVVSKQRIESDTRLIANSGFFDPDYYQTLYRDVASSKLTPLEHFVRIGGREGRNPSAKFDMKFYLDRNSDVSVAEFNPLVHYLMHGMKEGRKIRSTPAPAPAPVAPDEATWDDLAARLAVLPRRPAMLDVIVPVYRGHDETANCLYTVLESKLVMDAAFDLVVIDDASPEPELSATLDRIAAKGLITLLRNEENLGFVGTVNRGMSLNSERDVVLLNSDTEVYGDWLDRLHRAAYAEPEIGTVTPLSNNATICSYPELLDDYRYLYELPFAELDAMAAEVNAGEMVDVPTGVGFCLYIKRACLRRHGLFDLKAFGKGYGEENDFCQRVAAAGWRNVLVGDVFVRHLGRVSFLDTTDARVAEGLEILASRFPKYRAEIEMFCKEDQAKPLREALDVARLRRIGGAKAFLFVLHDLGGGTERHVQEMTDLLAAEGIGAYWLRPFATNGSYGVVDHPKLGALPNLPRINLVHGLLDAADLMKALNVAHIHVHHLQGFKLLAPQFCQALAAKLGVSYDVTVHDYTPICPRITMIDKDRVYCDDGEIARCELCIAEVGSPFGNVSVWRWRETYSNLLSGARKVFVPDEDVEKRLHEFWPDLRITVRAHPEPARAIPPVRLRRGIAADRRVAIIGAIGPHKGSELIRACAEDAARRKLRLHFVVIGHSDIADLGMRSNVTVTGKYSEEDLPALIAAQHCHLAFFSSVWPETYSYTLSAAYGAGLYPVTLDIGAVARRIRAENWGKILPWDWVAHPKKINDALLKCDVPPLSDGVTKLLAGRRYPNMLESYYDLQLPGASARKKPRRGAVVELVTADGKRPSPDRFGSKPASLGNDNAPE